MKTMKNPWKFILWSNIMKAMVSSNPRVNWETCIWSKFCDLSEHLMMPVILYGNFMEILWKDCGTGNLMSEKFVGIIWHIQQHNILITMHCIFIQKLTMQQYVVSFERFVILVRESDRAVTNLILRTYRYCVVSVR